MLSRIGNYDDLWNSFGPTNTLLLSARAIISWIAAVKPIRRQFCVSKIGVTIYYYFDVEIVIIFFLPRLTPRWRLIPSLICENTLVHVSGNKSLAFTIYIGNTCIFFFFALQKFRLNN